MRKNTSLKKNYEKSILYIKCSAAGNGAFGIWAGGGYAKSCVSATGEDQLQCLL
jgi:hypothetical protein